MSPQYGQRPTSQSRLRQLWHDEVFQRDFGACAARKHDPRCRLIAEQAHHIVYKSHLHTAAYWLPLNGIALSQLCHALAHTTHNQSLPPERLVEAVDTVNAVHAELGFPLRPYFTKKAA